MNDEQKVSQRYRELGAEEPPRELDETIIDAARRAAVARPAPLVAPAGRRRWFYPVAAAAVIVLAVAVTVHVERERPEPESAVVMQVPVQPREPAREDRPAREDKKAEVQPAAPAAVPAPAERAFAPDPSRQAARDAAPEARLRAAPAPKPQPAPAPKAPPAPAPKPQAAPAPKPEPVRPPEVAASRAEESARESAPVAAARAPEATADSVLGKILLEEPPETVLERIAELRKAGMHEEADKALEAFRKRYPDYKIPASALKQ